MGSHSKISKKDSKKDKVSKKEKKRSSDSDRKSKPKVDKKEAKKIAKLAAKKAAEEEAAKKAAEEAAKKAAEEAAAKKAAEEAARESSSESSSDDSSSSSSSESGSGSDSSSSSASGSSSSSSSKSGSDSSSSSSSSDDEADKVEEDKKEEEATGEPDPTARLYLGNCSFNINDEAVHENFDKYGKIVSIDWVTDKDTGKFYGTGFVQFQTAAAAKKALEMDQAEICGRTTKVAIATPKKPLPNGGAAGNKRKFEARELSQKPDGCNTVFCGGLPFEIDEDGMRAHFGNCGEIVNVRWVMRDDEFKGCGFVEFGGDASSAVDEAVKLNGSKLGHRNIRVDYAAPKPKRERY